MKLSPARRLSLLNVGNFAESPLIDFGPVFPVSAQSLQIFSKANHSQFEKRMPLKVCGSPLHRSGSKRVKDVQPIGALASSSVGSVKLYELDTG